MKSYKSSIIDIPRNFSNSDSVSLNLQCCICNEIFNNPMRLDCGHTYCYKCLHDWLKKKDDCPNCRIKVVDHLISRDLLAFNLTMELNVICNNEAKGCPWKGPLSDLVLHMKSCDTSIQIIREIEKENQLHELDMNTLQPSQSPSLTQMSIIKISQKRKYPFESTPQSQSNDKNDSLSQNSSKKILTTSIKANNI